MTSSSYLTYCIRSKSSDKVCKVRYILITIPYCMHVLGDVGAVGCTNGENSVNLQVPTPFLRARSWMETGAKNLNGVRACLSVHSLKAPSSELGRNCEIVNVVLFRVRGCSPSRLFKAGSWRYLMGWEITIAAELVTLLYSCLL